MKRGGELSVYPVVQQIVMMKKVFAALVFSTLIPGSVFALDVSVGSSGSANVGVDVSGEAHVDANAEAEATTTGEVVVDVPANAEIIVITREEINREAIVSGSAVPETVNTDAEISGYVAAQMARDTNVSKMESSRSRVSVTYPQKAKLFGLVSMTVDATATVLADGTVDVRYPWFAFLMVTNEVDLESDIESRVSALPSPSLNASANASIELSARLQAELIDTVRAAMESSLAAEAEVAAGVR